MTCSFCEQDVELAWSVEMNDCGDPQPGCGSGGHLSCCKICHDMLHGLTSWPVAVRAVLARQSAALVNGEQSLRELVRRTTAVYDGFRNAVEKARC